jgi:SNF family Na+-dependent transporter
MELVSGIVNILFNYLTQVYLERFEQLNCVCAYDVRKDLCKSFLAIFYVIIAGRVIFPEIPKSASFFIMLFTMLFNVLFISYIFSLKQKKCNCNNTTQDMMTNVFYYYYALLAFITIMMITMILMFIPLKMFNKYN